jgi:sulfite reductase alpha subunit-like flavoprotein
MGKFFNETMEELGAERVFKYGEGNAEGNHTEDDFNEWKADLWSELAKYYSEKPIKFTKEQKVEEVKSEEKPV